MLEWLKSEDFRIFVLLCIFIALMKSSWVKERMEECGDDCLRPAHLVARDFTDEQRLDKHRIIKKGGK